MFFNDGEAHYLLTCAHTVFSRDILDECNLDADLKFLSFNKHFGIALVRLPTNLSHENLMTNKSARIFKRASKESKEELKKGSKEDLKHIWHSKVGARIFMVAPRQG